MIPHLELNCQEKNESKQSMQTEDALNRLYSNAVKPVNKEEKLNMPVVGLTCRYWKQVWRCVIGMLQLIIIDFFLTTVWAACRCVWGPWQADKNVIIEYRVSSDTEANALWCFLDQQCAN